LKVEERGLAIRVFDEIILHFELCQATDTGYRPVTLIRLMKDEVSEKDEFLDLFFSFVQQDLLGERGGTGLEQSYPTLPDFVSGQLKTQNVLGDCLVDFAKYLVDNFHLPCEFPGAISDTSHLLFPVKALAVKPLDPPRLFHILEHRKPLLAPLNVSQTCDKPVLYVTATDVSLAGNSMPKKARDDISGMDLIR
jgi:hypothetical protein